MLNQNKNNHYIGFGTNDYPSLGPSSSLQKCESDVINLSKTLSDIGFDTFFYIKEHTAKEKIINAMKSAIDEAYAIYDLAGEKQYILFARSSHGSQQPDMNGDEDDNADECWMCYDSVWNKQRNCWNNVIIDDEIAALFLNVNCNKVEIDLISDTCHSGTFTRGLPQIINNRKFVFPRNFKQYKTKKVGLIRGILNRFSYQYWINADIDWALFAGAESDNFSYETASGGALTSAIISYVKTNESHSKKDAAKIIIDNVRRNVNKQNPHLECSKITAEKPFLNAKLEIKKKSFWDKFMNVCFGWII